MVKGFGETCATFHNQQARTSISGAADSFETEITNVWIYQYS